MKILGLHPRPTESVSGDGILESALLVSSQVILIFPEVHSLLCKGQS